MKEKIEKRVIRVTLRLNKSEFEKIQERMNNTRFRNTSSYFRYVLLEKKITTLYRNQSMDEEMEELIQLRKELNFIGHNYNQTVKKLNSVIAMPDARHWQQLLNVSKNELEPCIRKIKDRINQFADLWSQKSFPEKV
ncbi:MAG TPA: hypothetical protein VL125_04865 [Pelobium sp.]|nr:hypothetical protein [Pelobium sp.]